MPSPILLAELDGSDGFVLQGEPEDSFVGLASNGNRGFYLDGGGDANGDGFADILIGDLAVHLAADCFLVTVVQLAQR